MNTLFANRVATGSALAAALSALEMRRPVVVLALPRGGVPVGAVVATALAAPLDLVLVRKIGAPHDPELAVAAVAEGDPPVVVSDDALLRATGADAGYVETEAQRALAEIARRRRLYLGHAPVPHLAGCTVVVVDDGIATGATVRAALRAVRRQSPAAVVLAVPVAPPQTVQRLRGEVDRVVCVLQPGDFRSVGSCCLDFRQVDDDEVRAALSGIDRCPA